jgi:hypothetical protein
MGKPLDRIVNEKLEEAFVQCGIGYPSPEGDAVQDCIIKIRHNVERLVTDSRVRGKPEQMDDLVQIVFSTMLRSYKLKALPEM